MFVAMNRFKVKKGSERDFEQVWLSRKTHLEEVPGFIEFLGGEFPRLDAV
jgi:heme-degrading monooxygenase HmoA